MRVRSLFIKNMFTVLLVSFSLIGCGGMKSMKISGLEQQDPNEVYAKSSPCQAIKAMEEAEKSTLGYKLSTTKTTSDKTEDDFDEDQLLTYCEYGILKQACGDCNGSIKALTEAQKIIDHFDNKAKLSVSEVGKDTLSVIVNDNTMSYSGETYERVLIRSYQALNYLGLGDYNSARIEINEAYRVQEAEKKRIENKIYEKDLESSKANKGEGGKDTTQQSQIGWEKIDKELETANAEIDVLAERVKNSYENGFTYFLSSVVDELNGNVDSAYIDLKDAHDILPNNDLVLSNLIRIAKIKGRDEELNSWLDEQKKNGNPQKMELHKDFGRVIVIFHNGVSPHKEQIKIPIPLNNTIIFTAYPTFKPGNVAYDRFILKDQKGEEVGQSSNMVDLNAIMAKSHQEKRPAVIARMVARAIIKGVATNEVAKRTGLIGSIATSVFNYASESADLRSWKSLPTQIDVLEVMHAPGEFNFTIEAQSSTNPTPTILAIPVKIEANKPTIVNVFVPNEKMYYPDFNTQVTASQKEDNEGQTSIKDEDKKEKI